MSAIILSVAISGASGIFIGYWWGFYQGVKQGSKGAWEWGRKAGNIEADTRRLEQEAEKRTLSECTPA